MLNVLIDEEKGEPNDEKMPKAIRHELDNLSIYPFTATFLTESPGEKLLP